MGRVFLAKELACGDYPQTADAHKTAARQVIRDLQTVHGVTGSLIYGSAAMGHPNRRSDLDILVRHDESNETVRSDIDGTIQAVHLSTRVFIEPNIISDDQVEQKSFRFAGDLPFIDHLLVMNETGPYRFGDTTAGFQGLTDISPENRSELARTITGRYLELKYQKFAERRSGNHRPKDLQRAFELPSAVSRKLQICQPDQATDILHKDPEFYKRKNLEEQLQRIGGAIHAIADPAAWLARYDHEYTDLLENTIAALESESNVARSLEVYQMWMDNISPQAILQAMALAKAAKQLLA